jgi:membrane protease subunit HflC
MSLQNLILIFIAVAAIFLAMDSVYTVHQTERAILLRFGAVVDADVKPGLHFKMPIAEQIKKADARVLTLDAAAETYYTLEKKPLIVDSFVKWRVADVETFYTATSFDERRGERVLQERVNEGLRNQISRRDMHEVVSGERDQLMQELTSDLNAVMNTTAGIEVVDVRVKRIDLPPEVSSSVYERMNSERQIEARQYRAQGRELALGIRADAERQTVVIQANAYKESEELRGEGDAQSAAIYADAFNKDPEFYEFYRSINAYSNVFRDKGDLLVLDPSSDFFKFLKGAAGDS